MQASVPTRKSSQRGFSFIEILVVMGIIAVLAGMAAVFVPQIQESARQTESINNIKTVGQYLTARAAKRSGSFKDFKYNGKNFTLAPVAFKDIDIAEKSNLKIFFSPGDEELTLEGSEDEQWAAINKKSLKTDDFSSLTSYAGRRNDERDYMLTPKLLKRKVIILCDDDQGPLHHPGGLVICWSSGAAEYMEWDALGMSEPGEGAEFLGDAAEAERLQALGN